MNTLSSIVFWVFLFSVRELSDDEKNHIISSENFTRFFDKATRVVERAMCERIDLFMDYTGEDSAENDG